MWQPALKTIYRSKRFCVVWEKINNTGWWMALAPFSAQANYQKSSSSVFLCSQTPRKRLLYIQASIVVFRTALTVGFLTVGWQFGGCGEGKTKSCRECHIPSHLQYYRYSISHIEPLQRREVLWSFGLIAFSKKNTPNNILYIRSFKFPTLNFSCHLIMRTRCPWNVV